METIIDEIYDIRENTTDTLIGDFLDIYRSIINIDSKVRIFTKIKQKYYIHKLIKETTKISLINTPLSKANLLELISCVYSNYVPNGEYKCINNISYFPKQDTFIANITVNKCIYSIKISYKAEKFGISILTNGKRENKKYTIELYELYSRNKEIENYLYTLNEALVDVIRDYVIDTIESYTRKDKEYESR